MSPLTVQPALGLTADDADSMLSEATYTEDPDAVIGEIETFAMENGTEVKSVEVTSEGMVYRYWFIPAMPTASASPPSAPRRLPRATARAWRRWSPPSPSRRKQPISLAEREHLPFRFFIGSTLIPAPNHAIMDGKWRERP